MLQSEDRENWILKTFNGDEMTFASLEKLIREEARKVIENLERSFSLYEEDDKPASENPDKMLVVNKESGKSYYISKKNFDPSKHQKSATKSPKTEEEEPAADTDSAETSAEEPKQSDTSTTEEPEEEKTKEEESPSEEKPAEEKPKDDKKGEEKKEEPEKEPNEEKTGLKTVGFLNKVNVEKLDTKTNNLYPETREHLLQYDYEDIIDMYDLSVGDKDVKFSKLYKKIEMIAVSKHSLISTGELDKQTIEALRYYYTNSEKINNLIRFSKPTLTKKEVQTQIKLGKPKEGDAREKEYNSAMKVFTINELDFAFEEKLQPLQYNLVTYRSVENDKVLQMFIDQGQWVDKTFVTTSLNPLICEGTGKKRMPLFEFLIPAGTSILTLPCHSNDYCHETEVTLPRNCRYTIQGFNETRNIYKILVEENYGR
jgi:hypothetical protein